MNTRKRMKQLVSMLLCLCMLVQYIPLKALAEDNLCEHHTEHSADCGFEEDGQGCQFLCEDCSAETVPVLTEETTVPEPTIPETTVPETTAVQTVPEDTVPSDEPSKEQEVSDTTVDYSCAEGSQDTQLPEPDGDSDPVSELPEQTTTQETTEPLYDGEEEAPSDEAFTAQEFVTVGVTSSADPDLPDNQELFDLYVEQKLYGYETSTFGTRAREKLNKAEQAVYDELKYRISVVSSFGGSTVFRLTDVKDLTTSWTNDDLGVDYITRSDVVNALLAQIDLDNIISALLNDCPLELYWYDKTYTGGCEMSIEILYSGPQNGLRTYAEVSVLQFVFYVAKDYTGADNITVSTSLSKISDVKSTAQAVVNANQGKTDYEKLLAYKEYICDAVRYNEDAVEDDYTGGYGNPWQLIYVFDEDDTTDVVCEGYSKALQYLCDLGGLDCICATGTMIGASGEGPHMWNVVTLDNKNYLVDVTNCDDGTIGAPDKLFLVGSRYANGGYTFTCYGSRVTFVCDDLDLEESNYTVQEPGGCRHTGGNATCKNKAVCVLCGMPYGEFAPHDWDKDVCSVCMTVCPHPYFVNDICAGCEMIGGWFSDSDADELLWTLYDGVLTISGYGEMATFNYNSTPWYTRRLQIRSIIVENGVKSICPWAFYECRNVTTIQLPDSVTSIGMGAFRVCSSLTDINLPEELTTIESNLFAGCSSLRRIVLPERVTRLGESAFNGCAGLETIRIPACVTHLDKWALSGCVGLKEIYFAGNAPVIVADALTWIAATAYYPAGNATWTESVMRNYGGDITWICEACRNGHMEITDGGVAATCSGTGLTEGKHCGLCGKVLTQQQVIPARGHSYQDETVGPTYTNPGYTEYTCVNCGDHYRTVIKALGLVKPRVTAANNLQTGGGTLTWQAVAEADCYDIYRATSSGGKYTQKYTVDTTSADVSVPVGKTYYFKIKAVCEADEALNSSYSAAVKVTGKCAKPTVTATASASSGKPVVRWNKISGAEKYVVYRASGENGSYVKVKTTTGTSYTDTAAKVGTTYFYKVKALASESSWNSVYSAVSSCLTVCARPTVTLKTDAATGKPVLSWKAVSGAACYEISRAESADGPFVKLETFWAELSYRDSSAEPDKDYWYRVKTIGTRQELDSTEMPAKSIHATLAKPAVKFSVDPLTGKPTLSWKAVPGAQKYRVYRSTSATKSYKAVKTTEDTAYTDTSVAVAKGYYYKVIAIGENSNSVYSSYKKLTAKCAQAQITVTASKSSGKPVVRWNKISGAEKYVVYRASAENGSYAKVKTTTGTSYTDTSAKVGSTYFYKVKAVASDSSYNGVYSAVKSCLTVCARPTVTLKTDAATGKPVLSWQSVSGAAEYEIWESVNGGEYHQVSCQTDTVYRNEDAKIDDSYSYKVKAIADNPELNSAEAVSDPIIAACAKPVASIKLKSKKPHISWDAVDGAVSYKIYRSTKASSGYKKIKTVTDPEYTDTAAKNGTTYYYKVIAVSEKTSSAYSSYVKIKSK